MVLLEMLTLVTVVIMTPEGKTWLGSLIMNSADYAVYLNYLSQGAHGLLLDNLYNNLPQTPRFDLFWSLGGILVRFLGLSAIQVHELLRWSSTLFLGLAIYATAKAITRTEKMARYASCLIASGLGLGWLYALGVNLVTGLVLPVVPPDISTQFSIVPILLGGSHMILSVALQILILRWIWETLCQGKRLKPTLPIAIFFFTGFHPYYISLIGLFSLITLTVAYRKKTGLKKRISDFLLINLAMLPSFLYYAWIAYQDQAFKEHFLVVNRLALHKPIFWLICLVPYFVAAYFMLAKRIPEEYSWPAKPCWAYAWIVSAILCMLLPFPWTNKYAQGLLPALVIVTLPFWLWLSERWLNGNGTQGLNVWRKVSYVLFLCAPFCYLLIVQTLLTRSELSIMFYQPNELFQAWSILRDRSPKDSLILVDDEERALWTPTYALRTVWVGHGHESPDYLKRIAAFEKWLKSNNPDDFNGFLSENRITYVIATKPENQAKFEKLMDKATWHQIFEKGSITIWSKD